MEIRNIALVGMGIAIGYSLALQNSPTQDPKTFTVQDFPNLFQGLKQTPGILDVKVAILDGKKQTIFAWFKNKAAVNAWYTSKMHRDAMAKFFPNMRGNYETLAGFKDEKAPLLVVASVTPGEKLVMEGSALKAEQIAIEIYTPVPGGLTIGGGFGPKTMEVPGMMRIGD